LTQPQLRSTLRAHSSPQLWQNIICMPCRVPPVVHHTLPEFERPLSRFENNLHPTSNILCMIHVSVHRDCMAKPTSCLFKPWQPQLAAEQTSTINQSQHTTIQRPTTNNFSLLKLASNTPHSGLVGLLSSCFMPQRSPCPCQCSRSPSRHWCQWPPEHQSHPGTPSCSQST